MQDAIFTCAGCSTSHAPADGWIVGSAVFCRTCYIERVEPGETMTLDTKPRPESILDEAQRLTSSDRQGAYGHPRLHFTCTAAMVTAYLHRRGLLREGAALEPEDWAMLISLDKIARNAGTRKRDNLVDLAGYARTAEMLGDVGA